MNANANASAIDQLLAVVARLRNPQGGCPWDLAQTHSSLVPYVLEEAHEVADALRRNDDAAISEELGDLLLQVVLHAQLGEERGAFNLEQIAAGISAKLVRRHPHVFGGELRSWEEIKQEEQASRGEDQSLSAQLSRKQRGLSPLAGSMAISKRAAAAGFEWQNLNGVWAKVEEELAELKEAVASGNRAHAETELGDLLFTLVNVARWLELDPEAGLAGTNQRFLERFALVEAALGGDLQGRTIDELEGLWQQAKAQIRSEQA